ncbi:restriction endonuclease [Pasteurellaceae bacterium RH1A]|nr:restriction endonuclease [Pasteurellaceae bacterium RH1A]
MSSLAMNQITELSQLDPNRSYSYADYLLWQLKERVEIIKGKIVAMSPAPTRLHQDISRKINREFDRVFINHPCRVYYAPFDVRFPDQEGKIKNVVQPDLCVICDENKLDDKGCIGAPDLVVEILSPGNSKREMKYKYELYQEAGVLEYWVVRPEERNIHIYLLKDGEYIGLQPVVEGDVITSRIFPDLSFNTDGLYDL